jgi:hypothetical protein
MTELMQLPLHVLEQAKQHARRRGHAGLPGAGPKGETCRSCAHYTHQGNTAGSYPKCGLVRAHWTRGPGTDIRARDPACEKWTPPA